MADPAGTAAPPLPAPASAPAGPSYFVDSAGEVQKVAPEDVAGASELGWEQATPEQVAASQHAQELHEKYGGVSGALEAGTAAAARALTMGLSDAALTKSGLVAPETLQGLQEENPVASGIGTALGIAAPLVLTAGAAAPEEAGALGAAGTAAELSGPALAAKAGRAITGVLAGTGEATASARSGATLLEGAPGLLPEASGLLGRTLRSAVASGAGSAVEGAFYGLGQEVSEASLGDHDITAQSLLAHVGPMAAIGGGLGGVLGAGGELVPAALSRVRDAIGTSWDGLKKGVQDWYAGAENVHGFDPATAQILIENKLTADALETQVPGIINTMQSAQPATAQSILDNAPRFEQLEAALPGRGISKTLVLARPETLDTILQNSENAIAFEQAVPGALKNISQADPATAQNFLDNWSKIFRPGQDPERMALISQVRQSGNSVIDSTEKLFKRAYGEMMREGAGDLLADANPAAVTSHYDTIWGETQGAADMMAERPTLYKPYYAARIRKIMEDVAKESGEYAPGEAAAPKVAFDRLVLLRRQIGDMRVFGSIKRLPVDEQEAQPVLRHLYNKISDALTDPEAFGQAAVQKEQLDDAYSQWRRLIDRKPGASLGTSEKGTVNFNELLMKGGELAPSKVNSWFNNFDSDTAALRTEAWGRMMDLAGKAADTVQALHEAAPVTNFDREAATSLIGKTADLFQGAQERAALTSAYNRLDPRAVLRGSHAVLPGEPPAAAATANAVATAQAAASMVGHGPITSTVKAVLSPIGTAVETARSMPRSIALLSTLERIGNTVSSAIDRASGIVVRGSSLAASVGRAEIEAGIAREFSASPDAALSKFNKRVADIQRLSSDPNAMHGALVDQSSHLEQHAPNTAQALSVASTRAISFLASKIPQDPQAGPLAPKWQPSQSEIAKFARYYEATKNPLVVLKQAAAGTLTPEAIEAVQTVYPDLWSKKILPSITDKLATPGLKVPRRNALMLSMLTGVDLDGRIRALAANQAVHQSPSRQQADQVRPTATGLGKLNSSDRFLTPMQRSAQRSAG